MWHVALQCHAGGDILPNFNSSVTTVKWSKISPSQHTEYVCYEGVCYSSRPLQYIVHRVLEI